MPIHNSSPALVSSQGELVSVRIAVPWARLESLLDALAGLTFPLNPEIRHGSRITTVEFPAWSEQVKEVRDAISKVGPEPRLTVQALWAELEKAAC